MSASVFVCSSVWHASNESSVFDPKKSSTETEDQEMVSTSPGVLIFCLYLV